MDLSEENKMKGYLLSLRAMLVGVGLMFVLMHGEVSADVEEEIMHCKRYKAAKVDSCTYGHCEINNCSLELYI